MDESRTSARSGLLADHARRSAARDASANTVGELGPRLEHGSSRSNSRQEDRRGGEARCGSRRRGCVELDATGACVLTPAGPADGAGLRELNAQEIFLEEENGLAAVVGVQSAVQPSRRVRYRPSRTYGARGLEARSTRGSIRLRRGLRRAGRRASATGGWRAPSALERFAADDEQRQRVGRPQEWRAGRGVGARRQPVKVSASRDHGARACATRGRGARRPTSNSPPASALGWPPALARAAGQLGLGSSRRTRRKGLDESW